PLGSAKPKRSRKKLYVIAGVVVLLLIAIGSAVASKRRKKPILVTTDKAFRKTITQLVTATGKIQPEVEVKISPEVSGEIIDLPVEDGMPIKKGDLLVKIRPDSYKALVEQQEAAIDGAKSLHLQQKATLDKAE